VVEQKPIVAVVQRTNDIPLEELHLEDTTLWTQPMHMEARAEFERFVHYNNRFLMYKSFISGDQKFRKSFLVDHWVERYRAWTTPEKARDLLTDVWDAIALGREIIAWSYAFAYLVPPWIGTARIVASQAALESAIENLVDFMVVIWREAPLTRVGDLLGAVKKTREALLEAITACRNEQTSTADLA
jgi:hypothetical protein